MQTNVQRFVVNRVDLASTAVASFQLLAIQAQYWAIEHLQWLTDCNLWIVNSPRNEFRFPSFRSSSSFNKGRAYWGAVTSFKPMRKSTPNRSGKEEPKNEALLPACGSKEDPRTRREGGNEDEPPPAADSYRWMWFTTSKVAERTHRAPIGAVEICGWDTPKPSGRSITWLSWAGFFFCFVFLLLLFEWRWCSSRCLFPRLPGWLASSSSLSFIVLRKPVFCILFVVTTWLQAANRPTRADRCSGWITMHWRSSKQGFTLCLEGGYSAETRMQV